MVQIASSARGCAGHETTSGWLAGTVAPLAGDVIAGVNDGTAATSDHDDVPDVKSE